MYTKVCAKTNDTEKVFLSSTLNDQTSPKTICSQLVPFSAYNFLASPSSHLHALVPVPFSISSSYRPPPRSTFFPTQLGPVGITSLALTFSPPLPLPLLTPTIPTYGSIYFYLSQNSELQCSTSVCVHSCLANPLN